jgi:hypothetical protein
MTARRHFEIIAPRKIMLERISRMSFSSIEKPDMVLESIFAVLSLYSARHPSSRKIFIVESTSAKFGQFLITFFPPLKIVAAIIGKTAFLAP